MKKIILFVLPFVATATIFAQSNGLYVEKKTCATAIEYNDYVVDLITLVDKAWDKAIDANDLKVATEGNKELKTISTKVLASFKKLEAFAGDASFKAAAVDYVTHMNNISKKELPAFIKLIHGKGEFNSDREKKAEALIPMLDDRRESLFTAVEASQDVFAAKQGFTVK